MAYFKWSWRRLSGGDIEVTADFECDVLRIQHQSESPGTGSPAYNSDTINVVYEDFPRGSRSSERAVKVITPTVGDHNIVYLVPMLYEPGGNGAVLRRLDGTDVDADEGDRKHAIDLGVLSL